MRRVRRRRNASFMPEVTLTPLIDTALTLLIIFMITTPMLNNAIKVALPKSSLQEGDKEQHELVVSIDQKGVIYFNNNPVSLSILGQKIQEHLAHMGHKHKKNVWVRAHGATTTVDTLAAVIDNIKTIGGVDNVNIETQKVVESRGIAAKSA